MIVGYGTGGSENELVCFGNCAVDVYVSDHRALSASCCLSVLLSIDLINIRLKNPSMRSLELHCLASCASVPWNKYPDWWPLMELINLPADPEQGFDGANDVKRGVRFVLLGKTKMSTATERVPRKKVEL